MTDRRMVERIEQAALWAWPPRETAWCEGWLLRAGGGRTRRINSVRTLAFAQGADLDKAIARVEVWYAARDLPACFQLTELAAPARLDAVLADRGYRLAAPVSVLLVDAASVEPPERGAFELQTRPTPLVMNAVCDPHWGPEIRRARAELFARIRKPHVFGVLTRGQEPAAGGLCVVDGDLAGIFTMRTGVPFRGRGYGRALFRRLVAWAKAVGAKRIYLQVEDDNAAALALYRPFAPELAYRYWYREQTA
ncbi:GNAT family N-acetyltransferase [Benzoatithermus flavus]|uniref:GNAT family N-acetyltransferase n=1 Tax=Benzoatithermus flavus TaxID=3108223 RepID=A0ABU8XPX4_9PROT